MYKFFILTYLALFSLFIYLVYLIKSQKIKTEYSIIWIVSLIVLSFLSFSVDLLNKIAGLLGIAYPPSLIIVVIFLLGILILLNLTKTITKISDRNKINMQNIALSHLKNYHKDSDVLIIIPAYNEENNIEDIVDFIQKNYNHDILVINDCSNDNTSAILDKLNCAHVDLPYRSGYGIALETGYIFSSQQNYKYVVQIDGDGQHEPQDIGKLIDEIENNDFDAVIGSRFLSEESSYTPSAGRKFGIIVMRFILSLVSHKKVTDPTSGFQVLNSSVINFFTKEIRFPTEYPDADMLLLLHKNNFKFKEIPVRMYMKKGKSMHSGFFTGFNYSIQMLLSLFVIALTRTQEK